MNHDRPRRGPRRRDVRILAGTGAGAGVACAVDGHAEVGEALGARRPNLGRPFPDPAGEREHVEAGERGGHTGDVGAQTVQVDLERQGRDGIGRIRALQYLAHVGGPGQPEQPRLVLEGMPELGGRHRLVLEQP